MFSFTYISQRLHEFTYISQRLHEIVLWQAYMAKVWQATFCGEYPRNLVENQFFIHLKYGVFFSPDLMRIIIPHAQATLLSLAKTDSRCLLFHITNAVRGLLKNLDLNIYIIFVGRCQKWRLLQRPLLEEKMKNLLQTIVDPSMGNWPTLILVVSSSPKAATLVTMMMTKVALREVPVARC